ncbi:MAG: DsrE family protein [Deltaproteobacteria bacterium]|nr:DsrE family protein [Deltaproteobacteria bacterium]
MSEKQESPGLAVVWSSGEREVALNLVYMYTENSRLRGWWDRVRLIVWGPSAKLLSHDLELQDRLEGLTKAGVELLACKACADNYGVADNLAGLGIEVIYMGQPFTEMLKEGWTTITF